MVVDGCECHSSCVDCGYGENPTMELNCISCKGDRALIELFDDKSGYCVETCESIIDCGSTEFCNMENRETKGPSVCEPCVPKEYYSMKDVCNLESYTL